MRGWWTCLCCGATRGDDGDSISSDGDDDDDDGAVTTTASVERQRGGLHEGDRCVNVREEASEEQKKFNPKWGPGGKKNSSHPIGGQGESGEARAKTRSGKGNHRNSQMDKISKGTRWSWASVMASNAQVGGDAQGPAAMWSCPTWPGCWDCRRGRLTAGGALPEWYPDYLPSPPE